MNRRVVPVLALLFAVGSCAADDGDDGDGLPRENPRSGGTTTVDEHTREAFSKPSPALVGARRDDFFLGNSIFNRGWVIAPASVEDFDGLGPLFNATNCSGCHFKDGRGRPPEPGEPFLSILIRLGIPGRAENGGPMPEPNYGDQLQGGSILGVPPEGFARIDYAEVPGAYADGEAFSLQRPTYVIERPAYGPLHPELQLSPRTAPFLAGLGLLEAVPDDAIVALADPDDRDGDGISGRVNRVWDEASKSALLGRFGWKANQPSLRQQNAGAFNGDMGITSSLFPKEGCTASETECSSALTGPGPQLRDDMLEQVTFYTQTLAVPSRRNADALDVRRGRALFDSSGCGKCHTPTLQTSSTYVVSELTNQTIHPFTDLLLHDMGPELADGRADFEATGTEWRTPPLWGIGLVETVNRHNLLLHDGRARGFAEAILWHGGEAQRARDAFVAMKKSDRDAILAFLRSL